MLKCIYFGRASMSSERLARACLSACPGEPITSRPERGGPMSPGQDRQDRDDDDVGTPDEVADVFVTASRALIGLAIRSVDEAPMEVTVAQHRVLVLLSARGDLTIGDVADGLGVNRSNATRFCDRLQRLGLVQRARSPQDGRVVHVLLTADGRALVRSVTERRRREVEKVLGRLTTGQVRSVVDAMRAFNQAAGELEDRDWASALW
jgi:DNA-binding MarR family transcriptional regulator